jgi:hypothetical protein
MILAGGLMSSDHNRENQTGHANKPETCSPYSAGTLSVVGSDRFVRRKSTQALQKVSEHPQKPFSKSWDTCRINHQEQAEIENWTPNQEYGHYMIQYHALILTLARQESSAWLHRAPGLRLPKGRSPLLHRYTNRLDHHSLHFFSATSVLRNMQNCIGGNFTRSINLGENTKHLVGGTLNRGTVSAWKKQERRDSKCGGSLRN